MRGFGSTSRFRFLYRCIVVWLYRFLVLAKTRVSSTYLRYNLIVPDAIKSETTNFSNSERIMLAKIGPNAYPTETPFICSKMVSLNENAVLVHDSKISFFRDLLERVVEVRFCLKTRSRII